ncbi:MAG: glycosyl hydrolase [Verrucomicrobia bacterium]|nr:glycosyl hydrolase [Verrucomicrobiota bacterium]
MNCEFGAVLAVTLAGFLATAAKAGEAAMPDFAARFAHPPSAARILKIIHSWPDKPEAQDGIIAKLRGQGFGGVVCNVSFDQYLESEAKWQAFTRAVQEAKKAGMALWLYDERGYPSGNAGGITLRGHPEWEARGLLISDTDSQGGPCTLNLPPGQPMLVAAFPVLEGRIELGKKVDLLARVHEGKVEWQAPAGAWRLLAVTENRLYEGTHADGNLWSKMPYVNLLMAEPTARFIEVTHQAYAKHLGDDLGQYFMGTFTDEPSLMSLFLKPMPYRPLPWSPGLAVEFKQRRGYALDEKVIPSLMAETGAGGEKHRYDYWLTVGELVSANFFGQIQSWGRQHNIPSGGHLLLEESIAGHVPLYGDFFRCIRRLDAPSIDCLTSLPSEVPWYIARLLASAAELEGRTIVMCETSDHAQHYRPPGDQRAKRVVSEAEIRGTCNRLIVSGVNCITSYYSFAGLSDEQLRRLNEWIGRACTLVTGGQQVADVALLYPTESLWTKFVPSRHWTREAAAATRIEHLYRAAADSLFACQRDFSIVDSRALIEAEATVGELVDKKLRWRVVVLPGVDTLPLAAWENLARFVREGGIVVALGRLPANSENEFPSSRVAALGGEIFGEAGREPRSQASAGGGAGVYLPSGSEGLLPLVLRGALESDVTVAETRSPLRVTHRRIGGREVYFVINDRAQPWSGDIAFAAAGGGERWDLMTGRMAETVKGSTAKLDLEPYGAAGFRFAEARSPQKRALVSGPLPGLVLRTLPKVEPTAPHGEFVRAEIGPEASPASLDASRWRASATLTKSQVDTHLFAQFHFAQPADLSEADCLVVETWVPEGQRTPSQILVILHEEGGGDFIASTGRSLAAPGRERSFVPLSRFELAGWSKSGKGKLDLKRVSEIRIGWGGYLGAEGEKVVFSLAMPQTGAVGAGTKL